MRLGVSEKEGSTAAGESLGEGVQGCCTKWMKGHARPFQRCGAPPTAPHK